MKFAPIPADDEKRLLELKRYSILDTPPEAAFDEITKLAALICGVKISLVSLIDKDRQWFKSRYGLEASETPRDISFCGHAILGDDIFIVEDAEFDSRFHDNPLFLNQPYVRFYAGVPLTTPSGSNIGTLCVIDSEKKILNQVQIETLKLLAKHVINLFENKVRNEELHLLSSKYSVLFNQAVDAVMTLSPPNWFFNSANPATLKLFGASTVEEFCSLGPWAVSPEFQPDGTHSSDKAKQMIGAALEKGSHLFEWTHTKLNGSPMACLVQLSKITEPNGTYLHATVRDISAQKEMENQLLEAQSISKVGSWTFNVETKEQSWSREHYKIFEIEYPQPQDKLYQLYRDRIALEDLARLDRLMERAVSHGEDFIFDHKIFLDHGKRIKYVQGIGKVNRNDKGKVCFLTGTCRDRTTDVEAETKSQTILESMEEGLVVQSSNGTITQFNTAALNILEMNHDQLLGKSSTDASWKAIKENGEPLQGEDHPAMVTLRTGKAVSNFIMGLRYNSDKRKWLRINSKPYQEGNNSSVLTTFSDITELLATKEEIRFVLETVLMGIWKYNPNTQEVIWDKSMYSLYEIEPGQFHGHFEEWASFLTDSAAAMATEAVAKALSGEKEFDLTFEIKCKSGTRHIGAKAKVLRNDDGHPLMMYGINWDRTKEYELEKNLEIEKAKSVHSAKLATIGELAAGVGHEINNPLAIISGQVSIAADILKDTNPNLQEVLVRLGKMDTAVGRISEVVKSLRTFARSDDTQVTHFDPYDLAEETINSLKELLLKEDVLLSFLGTKKSTLTVGNRGRIQQVLVNLIMNGKDASLGKKNRKVDVEIFFDSTVFSIVVTDNGSGIPDELRQKIFDPFFTTKDVNKGTGIGLSLVSTIIKEHNGKLDLVTKLGEGTSFKVTLPLLADTKPQPQKVQEQPKNPSSNLIDCNVLIVDDEEEILEICDFVFSSICRSVVTAHGARAGYEKLKQGGIDLVISDIRMPEIDGFEFLKLIRGNKEIRPPKFMFMTGGVHMSDSEVKIMNQSTDGFFTKPLVEAEISKKIKQLFPA